MQKNLLRIFSTNKILAALIVLGSVYWSLPLIRSGLVYGGEMYFWGANGVDGVWHISLAKSLARGSFSLPIMSGAVIENYHIGYDLLLAMLHRATLVPMSILYFQVAPVVLSALIGILVYNFVYSWKNSVSGSLFAVLFVYFGWNFDAIAHLIKFGVLGGESLFWAQPAGLTQVNPPYALSLVVILLAFNALQKNNLKADLIASLLFGILFQIKAYAAVVVLASLLAGSIYSYFSNKSFRVAKIFILSLSINISLYLLSVGNGSLLIFKPFWFLETMMSAGDRLGWTWMADFMINSKTSGLWYYAVPAYIVALLLFWYGNMGIRFIAEFYIAKKAINKNYDLNDVLLFSAIIAGFILPLFFIQNGTNWNTIQFFYYSIFFASIISGIVFSEIVRIVKKNHARVLVYTLLVSMAFSAASLLKPYLASQPSTKISASELEALEFLERLPEGTVLSVNLKYTPANISAFGDKDVYLEYEGNLDIMGIDYSSRSENIKKITEEKDKMFLKNIIHEAGISYVYDTTDNSVFYDMPQLFRNDAITIYSTQ